MVAKTPNPVQPGSGDPVGEEERLTRSNRVGLGAFTVIDYLKHNEVANEEGIALSPE
jgi:hypothetical protein